MVELEGAPPAWVDGSAIRLSSDALTDVMLLGMYLGHDVYVAMGSDFPLSVPHGLGDAAIRHQRDSASAGFTPMRLSLAGAPVELIKCPSTFALCAEPQAAAIFSSRCTFP